MAWVCPLCSTANEDCVTECMVCGQERIFTEEPRAVGSSWGAALARATETPAAESAHGATRSWGAALAGVSESREEPSPHSWRAALARAEETGSTASTSTESAAARLARAISSSED